MSDARLVRWLNVLVPVVCLALVVLAVVRGDVREAVFYGVVGVVATALGMWWERRHAGHDARTAAGTGTTTNPCPPSARPRVMR